MTTLQTNPIRCEKFATNAAAVILQIPLFLPEDEFFSALNDCCKFLENDDVNMQSIHKFQLNLRNMTLY